jgi:seryl-tRNA synthetase
MNNAITTLAKATLPTLANDISPMNIVDKYFDYKAKTRQIEHQTEKLRYQTEVIIKELDNRLQLSLDENKKNFSKEMFRLKTLATSIKNESLQKDKILKEILALSKTIRDKNLSLEEKQMALEMVSELRESLKDASKDINSRFDNMLSYDANTKQIK